MIGIFNGFQWIQNKKIKKEIRLSFGLGQNETDTRVVAIPKHDDVPMASVAIQVRRDPTSREKGS